MHQANSHTVARSGDGRASTGDAPSHHNHIEVVMEHLFFAFQDVAA